MSNLYTVSHKNKHKAVELNIRLFDITVKTGDKDFAPTWDLLMRYKAEDSISEEQYTQEYTALMQASFNNNPNKWIELLKENIALVCYCAPGNFCHRHLLSNILIDMGLFYDMDVSYIGELC